MEKVQRHAGCQLLDMPRPRSAHVMVRGELGWIRMTARRDTTQLRFLHRLHNMPPTLLTKLVYDARRRQHEQRRRQQRPNQHQQHQQQQQRDGRKARSAPPARDFFAAVQQTLDRYGLQLPARLATSASVTATRNGGHNDSKESKSKESKVSKSREKKLAMRAANRAKREWARKGDAAVLCYEKKAWHDEVHGKDTGKSPFYAAVKAQWGREAWLGSSSSPAVGGVAAVAITVMATTTAPAAAVAAAAASTTARVATTALCNPMDDVGERACDARLAAVLHAEDAKLHPSPLCTMCNAGVNEDQVHIMSACSKYAQARADLTAAVMAAAARGGVGGSSPQQWHDATDQQRTITLLTITSPTMMVRALNTYLHRVFKVRAAEERARAAAAAAAAATAAAVAKTSPFAFGAVVGSHWPRSVIAARRRAQARGDGDKRARRGGRGQ